jgi:hypothetical protein
LVTEIVLARSATRVMFRSHRFCGHYISPAAAPEAPHGRSDGA